MERLRKIKRSAIFIDFLLILAAVLSIIGLSVFVRFHGSPKPAAADTPKETIAGTTTPSYDVLDASIEQPAADSSSPPATSTADPSLPAGTSVPASETRTSPVVNPVLPISVPKVPLKTVCDEIKKAVLKTSYNKDVIKENERYQHAVTARYGLIGGLFVTLDIVRQQLMPEHQKNLSTLQSVLQSQLAVLHCSL